MTNAERYLKDGVIYHELACEIAVYMSNSSKSGLVQNIDDFFKQRTRPLLSREEKSILRGVNNELYTVIGRDKNEDLYFDDEDHIFKAPVTTLFGHLFRFINDGEEYKIKDLLNEEGESA